MEHAVPSQSNRKSSGHYLDPAISSRNGLRSPSPLGEGWGEGDCGLLTTTPCSLSANFSQLVTRSGVLKDSDAPLCKAFLQKWYVLVRKFSVSKSERLIINLFRNKKWYDTSGRTIFELDTCNLNSDANQPYERVRTRTNAYERVRTRTNAYERVRTRTNGHEQ
jgi:hypothetical protein